MSKRNGIGTLVKGLLLRLGEAAGALVIVMVFFAFFMGIITLTFPQGTQLGELMFKPGEWASSYAEGMDIDVELLEEDGVGFFAALLQQTRRTVMDKRAGAIAWSPARMGTRLENRHSVQTFSNASAMIRFGTGTELRLDENSLIVVRKLEENRRTGQRRASMLILDGTLAGGSDAASDEAVPMEILTASGSSLVVPAASGRSDYRVTVNPDQTSTFAVYSGTAEIVSAGETVTLEANQTLTVRANEAPGRPQMLPHRPEPMFPEHETVIPYSTTPPRVEFAWDREASVESYRLVIGRDPQFENVAYEGRLEDARFVHGNLEAGTYYWKVSGVRGWAEGVSSPPRRLELVHDVEPPTIDVELPTSSVRDDELVVRGTTEPGAEVFIGDASVRAAATGEFEHAVRLERGLNVVVIEAVDEAGNIAYRSELIKSEPGIAEGTP